MARCRGAMRAISMPSTIALLAERIDVEHLVGQGRRGRGCIRVADRGMDVDRLDRIAAGACSGCCASARGAGSCGSPPGCRGAGRGRCRSNSGADAICEMTRLLPPKRTLCAGLRAWMVNSGGAVRDQLEDHVAVETHPLAALAHVGAVLLHDLARAVVQHVDADLLAARAARRDGSFPARLRRSAWSASSGIFELPERRLLEGGRAAGAFSGAAAAARALGRDHRFGWMQCGGHGIPRVEVACRRHNGPRPTRSVRKRRPVGRGKRHR